MKDPYCDCCKREYETFSHILQVCPRTHRSEIERHNSVPDCVERSLKDRDACVEREVRIPTQEGIRKPDLMAYVFDRQVVADHDDFNGAHQKKIRYYDKIEIRNFVLNRFCDVSDIVFSSVTLNWSGKTCHMFVKLVKVDLGLSRHLKSTLVLNESAAGRSSTLLAFSKVNVCFLGGKQLETMQQMTFWCGSASTIRPVAV